VSAWRLTVWLLGAVGLLHPEKDWTEIARCLFEELDDFESEYEEGGICR